MASIEIKGVNELIRKLGTIGAIETFRPAMQRSVMRIQREMATYPAQRTGSQYVRTGTLGRRWTTKVTQTRAGLIGTVGNNTKYGPFVQSHQFQASIHRGRWQTDEDVVEQNRPAIVADFDRVISTEINK